jgi:hypothetical protein
VRVGQVPDTDLVAHTGAIRSRIVRSKDPGPGVRVHGLEHERDEVLEAGIPESGRGGPDHVEVAQMDDAESVRGGR